MRSFLYIHALIYKIYKLCLYIHCTVLPGICETTADCLHAHCTTKSCLLFYTATILHNNICVSFITSARVIIATAFCCGKSKNIQNGCLTQINPFIIMNIK